MNKYIKKKHANHCFERALNRYSLSLAKKDLDNIVKMIKLNQITKRKKLSLTKSIFLLKYKDKDIKLIYDKTQKDIATFLPIYDKRI